MFTSIDTRTRYNLGNCDCTPRRRVAVVADPALAADLACGVGSTREATPEQMGWT